MILQIAGTSGSGKSHLMRSFIAWADKNGERYPEHIEGRSQPIGYRIITGGASIYIPGAYEEAGSGGCDSVKSIAELYDTIRDEHASQLNAHVFFEGLFVMNMTRGPALAEEFGDQMIILHLATSLATCIASINSRRAERDEGALLTKENTIGNFKRAENYCAKMKGAGARVIRVPREQGLNRILELLVAV